MSWTIASKFNIFFEIIILTFNCKNLEIIKKRCSSNCSNLQASMNFLKISKPAGNWWGTPVLGNSSWGALHYIYENVNRWIYSKIYLTCVYSRNSTENILVGYISEIKIETKILWWLWNRKYICSYSMKLIK